MLSDADELIRAVPVSAKVRLVGRVNVRASTGSGSDAGATGATRWRVITRTSRCDCEADPAEDRRSPGIEMTSWARAPPTPTSARPTGEAAARVRPGAPSGWWLAR